MRFHRRIHTIYSKELIDILRDHRTLIAMIVVPIVLYPLLMLGSVQAVSFQAGKIEAEVIHVSVLNEAQGRALLELIKSDRAAIHAEQDGASAEIWTESEVPPIPEEGIVAIPAGSIEEMDRQIRERKVHLGVVFGQDELVNDTQFQNKISWRYDKEDVRGAAAQFRLNEIIQRVGRRTVEARKAAAQLPQTFDVPFAIETIDLSAPPSILGQILPLILVLMTITGAIYPAIDLTAGERERGTLESLMVTPVPVIDIVVGKFLVVTTVALMGAALNLLSVTATVYFGGFRQIIASSGGAMPLGTMGFILLALIPFAVLMSALMIAVCSFARTFKEAQNYVTPIILAVLIPGGIAALPATRLEGVMMVMPVGNMVLLARDMLLGAHIPAWAIFLVILSTTLYAGAAVAIAAGVFGRESVVFSDAASLGSMFRRRLIKPHPFPTVSMALLVVSLLFPIWFFVQGYFSPQAHEDARKLLYASARLMPVLFIAVPLIIVAYWKIDWKVAFALRVPPARYVVAAMLIGVSAWAPAHEVSVLQQRLLGTPEAVMRNAAQLLETLRTMPLAQVILILALIPAVCEELLFRGFLLSGIGPVLGKWGGILLSAAVFGVFHFFLFRFTVTAGLGVVLGYLCWQSRSIWPGVLGHFLHNALGAVMSLFPDRFEFLQGEGASEWSHIRAPYLIAGLLVFALGLVVAAKRPRQQEERLSDADQVRSVTSAR